MSFDGKCFLCKTDIMIFDSSHNPIGRNSNFSQVYVVMRKPILDGEEVTGYKTSRMKAPVCSACAKTCAAADIFDRAILQSEPNAVQYQSDGFEPHAIERI